MGSSGLIENFETGLFEDKDGRRFVRCEYNPNEPVWIDVTSDRWRAVYAGRTRELDWAEIDLPHSLILTLQPLVRGRMRCRAPTYLTRIHGVLCNFSRALESEKLDISKGLDSLSVSSWLKVWRRMSSSDRSIFRSVYRELAAEGLAGANFTLSKEMDQWKARSETQTLRGVINWNAETGAFTSAEWEIIRGVLNRQEVHESDSDCATRIFASILSQTLKRPQQVLFMRKDALWCSPSGREFFVRIPKAKGQSGEAAESWQIPEALAKSIKAYSERPAIRALQERFDRLIVMPLMNGQDAGWMFHRQVDGAMAADRLQAWIRDRGLISPRTDHKIKLSPYRIRHTGATAMAIQGVPRDQIQEILEHDSPYSADAYIQAVGSDLMPALERVTDRGVGEIFSELSNAYFFRGSLVDNLEGRRPIHVPVVVDKVPQPAVVGECGKDGACTLHPFWACYNGCPHFLAWKDAPHHKSLDYVESELKRWSAAEGGKERSKLGKDFDRVGAAIREVIDQAEQEQPDEASQ